MNSSIRMDSSANVLLARIRLCSWVQYYGKMLYDNALLARTYLHAGLVPGEAAFQRVVTETLEFIIREMIHPDGGFYSSLDADSEGGERKFYVWTLDGIRAVRKEDLEFFGSAYAVSPRGHWEGKTVLQSARELAGGFFDTPHDGEPLLVRPRDVQDNATPSGNTLACEALLKLAAFTDQEEYRDLAEGCLRLVGDTAVRFPTAFARWLSAAQIALDDGRQVAVMGKAEEELFQRMIQVIRSEYRPDVVIAASPFPASKDTPALLRDRPLIDGKATAYVCQGFICKMPTNEPDMLEKQLKQPIIE